MKFLTEFLQGATPNIDEFVAELGDRLTPLKEYQSTPQDLEWHAEGDVHIHVGVRFVHTKSSIEEGCMASVK